MNRSHSVRTRALVLGASNVRRSIFPLIEQILSRFQRPVDILIACGHGRSYCRANRVLGWSLPGIANAEWVPSWQVEDDAERVAVVTDIGNDLLYGIEPSMLLDHVALCLNRMRSNDRVMVMGLPIERLMRVDRLQFGIFRKIFFPGSRLSLKAINQSAHEVDQGLHEMVLMHRYEWLSPPSTWYGIDPIHIRNRHHHAAWSMVFERLAKDLEGTIELGPKATGFETLSRDFKRTQLNRIEQARLVFSRAKQQSWLGFDRSQSQPSLHFLDGSRVSFY